MNINVELNKNLADTLYTISEIPVTTTVVTDAYLFETQSSSSGESEQVSATVLATYFTSKVTLQTAYDNYGTISISAGNPLTLKSFVAGFLLPSMTTAQFSAISTLNNGEMAWDNELDRITVNANTDLDRRIETVAYLSDITSIESDAAYGVMRLIDNTTATDFDAPATPVKIAGTYSSGDLLGFTQSGGTLTCNSTVTRHYQIIACVTSTYDGSSNNTTFLIYLNGSPITADKKEVFIGGVTPASIETTLISISSLSFGDTLEFWVQNEDGTASLLVQDMTFSAASIGGVSSGSSLVVEGEDYLDLTGDVLTAYPVDLTYTNVTGVLKETRGGTNQSSYAQGDILYASASNTLSRLAKDTNATRYLSNTGSSNSPAWAQINLANGVTGTLPTANITNQAVTYAKIQNVTSGKLLGRASVGSGSTEEITLGTGLSLSGTTLNATGGGTGGLPFGYIYGLNAQYASASTLTLNSGTCRNSTDSSDITLASPQTINIATSGANGLDTGVEAINTWYAIFAIADSSNVNPTAGLLSVSATSPILPAGYDIFRRVGWVRNSAASNFVKFTVDGMSNTRTYYITDSRSLTQVLSSGNATTNTTIALGVAIPSTSYVGSLTYAFTPNVGGDSAQIYQTGSVSGSSVAFIRSAGGIIWGNMPFIANSSQHIDYVVSSSSDLLSLYVSTYTENV